eukprot:CAMPEP_0197255214 /NCGR_PEP_ID=MMETSP1429-20130617/71399_1 /TAXON_ID=49237 /ORGANISM="Chaetoceros  sp., Strain UNC1202" /LENGTH=113 /DNA_ID=CAMNT_0042718463 /DNA_START=706 /DNA_END=1044 /DNA_ORIENTATION=+
MAAFKPLNFNATIGAVSSTLGCHKLFNMPRRNFSSTPAAAAPLSPEAEMEKFELTATASETAATATDVATIWEPTWWPQDQMLQLIVNLHDATGWNYAITIAALTFTFRAVML